MTIDRDDPPAPHACSVPRPDLEVRALALDASVRLLGNGNTSQWPESLGAASDALAIASAFAEWITEGTRGTMDALLATPTKR